MLQLVADEKDGNFVNTGCKLKVSIFDLRHVPYLNRFTLIITAMKKLITLLFVLLSFCGKGQEYFNTRFEFGNEVYDGAVNALEIDDGYIVNGSTGDSNDFFWNRQGMVKIDIQGNVLWRKSWGDTVSQWWYCNIGSLIKCLNAYYSVGSRSTWYDSVAQSEIVLIKYNTGFDTLWTVFYGKKHFPYDTSYIPRNFKCIENGFIITGTMQPEYGGKPEIFLIKLDSLGNLIWEKNYQDDYYYEGMSVLKTTDSGYAIGAYKWIIGPYGTSVGDPVVIKTDSLGNKEWELNIGGPYQDGTAILCLAEDGNILAAARYDVDSLYYNRYRSRIQLTKIDNSGNILWNRIYGDKAIYESVSNIRAAHDNGVVITGSHWEDTPNYMGFMLRVDNLGDSLWYRQYSVLDGETNINFLNAPMPLIGGGSLGAGWCYPSSSDTGTQDAWAIKVDSLGCTSQGDCWVDVPEHEVTETSLSDFTVYPNPSTGVFNIRKNYPQNGSWQAELFDIYGNRIKRINVPAGKNETKLNVANTKKGLYIIRISYNNGKMISRKVILNGY